MDIATKTTADLIPMPNGREEIMRRTLEWVNTIRTELGADALDELPKGSPRSSTRCPVARALTIGQNLAHVVDRVQLKSGYSCKLPPVVKRFTALFDYGHFPELVAENVAPFLSHDLLTVFPAEPLVEVNITLQFV